MGIKNFLSKSKVIDIQSELPDGVLLVTSEGIIQWENSIAPQLLASINSTVNTNINDYLEKGMSAICSASEIRKPAIAKIVDAEEYIEISAKNIDGTFVVTMRDATQKYKTVNNIIEGHEFSKKVNYDKNEFLMKLANDLKSPLHSIIGFSQAIIDGLGGTVTEKQEKYLKIISKNSSDLLYFFNKLVELSQTESIAFDKDVKFFDISNVINAVIKTNEQLYSEKKIETSFTVAENTKKTLYSDEKAFKQLFQTLIETIIRSTDIGTLDIELSNADEEFLTAHNFKNRSALLITIISSSNTVLESEIPTLFDPYAVIEKSNKRNVIRAMSLACVRNIMNYLHGIVWAETIPLKGTAFKIIIPFEKDVNE